MHLQYECDTEECGDCDIDETQEHINFECQELFGSDGSIYEKWVCEDCSTLTCDLDLLDGTDANTNCSPTTGEPIAGNHCLTYATFTDAACTERYVPKSK